MVNTPKARKLFDEAVAALGAKNLTRAKQLSIKLVKADRKNFSCWHLKAAIHGELLETDLAEIAFVKAATLAPSKHERAKIYEQLSLFLMQNRKHARAVRHLRGLQDQEPSRVEFTCYLADALRLSNKPQEALVEYDKAIVASGDLAELLAGKALALQELGRLTEAIESLQQLLAIKPDNVDAHVRLTDCYIEINDFDSAEKLLLSALDDHPTDIYIRYRLALLYRDFGDIDRATAYLEGVVSEKQVPATIIYNYARIKTFESDHPIIEEIQRRLDALTASHLSPAELKEKTELLFALGKISEDCRQYDRAFEYWRLGNIIKRRTYQYSISDDRNRVAAIKAQFRRAYAKTQVIDEPNVPAPVFIIGLPRSGSTLVEQILASHSGIQGLGELTLLPNLLGDLERSMGLSYPEILTELDVSQLSGLKSDYLSRSVENTRKPYFTDKLPGNFWLVGLIHLLFPQSPVINVIRNPMDAGFSCFKHLFSGPQKFAYNLTEIRQYIELQRELMSFWHEQMPGVIHDLHYEDLVNSPDRTVASLLSFVGLSFQQDCLDFHNTKRAVKSSSAAQIRQPLHRAAVGFSQHYRKHLDEIANFNHEITTN